MNRYFILIGMIVLLVAGSIFYRIAVHPAAITPVGNGVIKNFTVTVKKDKWQFYPGTIEVEKGDTVKLTLVNEDGFDHGFAVDAFGVSQRLPASSTTNIEFVVTQEGEYPFYCNLPCGEGEVDGVHRGHFDMEGVIKVKPSL